ASMSRSPNGTAGSTPAAVPPEPAATEARPAAAPPAAASERKVVVESDPSGAAVDEGGKVLCPQTPCEVTFAAGAGPRTITVEKQGFEKALLTVNASDGTVKAKLSTLSLNTGAKSGPVQTAATKTAPARPPPPAGGGSKDYKDDP